MRARKGSEPETATIVFVVSIVVACFVFGGSSRADSYAQLFVRAAAIIIGVLALLWVRPQQLMTVRAPLLLALAWAALMASQLVPLPPALWTSLPGREQFVDLAGIAGIPQPWRPISLVPHATLNSVLAMTVPLAALVCLSMLQPERYRHFLALLALLVVVSGTVGVAQVASGGSLYFYEISNRGDAVGLFANRNHQAVFLAISVPILAGLVSFPLERPHPRVSIAAALVFILIFPLLFVTGSRQGVVLLFVGIVLGYLVLRKAKYSWPLSRRSISRFPLAMYGAAAVVLATALLVLFRVGAVDRMISLDIARDVRLLLLPVISEMAWEYLPFGTGFGAFPDLFKIAEPAWSLSRRYVNHAHNDLLEIVIEGGLPAILLLLSFLAWAAAASFKIWRAPFGSLSRRVHLLGLVGSSLIVILLLASLADYPLRTPFLAALLAISAGFVSVAARSLSYAREPAHPTQ